jgi:VIT1/CCC1 family predicted Fe2+/Mn2+ transporter
MANTKNSRLKSQSNYRYVNFQYTTQVFDAEKYKDNIIAIQKLHEERETAFAESNELKDLLEETQAKYHKLELQKKESDIKLNEANIKMQKYLDLERQIETLKTIQHDLELEKQSFELKLDTANQKLNATKKDALLTFVTSTVGGILFTLGANVVTSHPDNWLAWVLSVAGVFMAFIAFFISRRNG